MANGFLAGIFWGGVVGASLLVVSSQMMERQQLSFPRPEASPVEVPGGTEFDQAQVESDPVLPGTEETPGEGVVAGVVAPEQAVDAPPAFDTSALEVPQPAVEGPAGLGEAPEVGADITVPGFGGSNLQESTGADAGGPASPELESPATPIAAPETDTSAPEPGTAPGSEEMAVVESGSEDTAPEAATEIAALPAGTGEAAPSLSESAPPVQSQDAGPVSPVSPEISEAPTMPGVVVPGTDDAPDSAGVAVEAPEADAEPPAVAEPEPAPAPVPAPEPTPEPEAVAEVEPEPEPAPEPEAVVEAEPAPEPAVVPAPEVAEAPESGGIVTVDGGESQFFTPVEALEDQAENVEVNRLQTVGGDEEDSLPVVRRLPGTPVDEEAEEVAAVDEAGAEMPEGAATGPAIRAFAMDYEGPGDASVVSVVLLQDGDSPLPGTDLARVPPEVAFAIDAGMPNAAGLAAAYRDAGREVVMIPSLPAGATPRDVEVALNANLTVVPEAVAVMDFSGSSFQSDRDAVAQVVAVVADTGHGIITFPRGLNTAHQQAERAGLPTGLIFRILDEDGETDEQIRRTLDRAAFRARQSDAVILVGHTRAGTLAALREWADQAGGDVALAPISSALSPE